MEKYHLYNGTESMGTSIEVATGGEPINIEIIPAEEDLRKVIWPITESSSGREDIEDPFYVVDLGRLFDLKDLWDKFMPQTKIFYAVKCNHDLIFLKTLASLGIGFDCASKGEIKMILDLGVSPDRIIYANPIKQISHIQYAAETGVDLMTFDSESELIKIRKHFPSVKLILRISGSASVDHEAKFSNVNVKFGASMDASKTLLKKSKELGLNVVGISFLASTGKRGVGARSAQYKQAIECCDMLFQYGAELGYNFTVLDIGGGFPESEHAFRETATGVMKSVAKFTARYPKTEVITEPGRYLAASPYVLVSCIISKKLTENGTLQYSMTDSVFGAYLPDYPFQFKPLKLASTDVITAAFWGRTCAPDCLGHFSTPELEEGDWVYFENMGAYSSAWCPHSTLFPDQRSTTMSTRYTVKDCISCFISKSTFIVLHNCTVSLSKIQRHNIISRLG